ncbi:hypothetical protein VSH64_33110 [Amycolatopsis rhabdoformis]|uniref:Uncharacterized protein n=1 Tax=Amycolatopsis rhabdoformis TaxID=1448059 RepID=A0ABZ1HZQ9_9PSEU|nr:hypothetical protein [Amycolatopsis rhabdoformis]WSE27667.1 hypothetical protein VSH64_33110 [Amycolatopsis rhabdoformis]
MGLRWLPRTRGAAWAYLAIGVVMLGLLIWGLITGITGDSAVQLGIVAFIFLGFTSTGIAKLVLTRE